jgi:hypothetical protein
MVLSQQYADGSVLCWNISATLSGETLGASVARGCPQGGVLSLLLWRLVVDDFLWELNDNGYYMIGYADDIAICVRGLTNSPVHSPTVV